MNSDPTSPAAPSPVASPPTANESVPFGRRILRYKTLLGLALAVFAFDQATKWWIVEHVPFGHHHGLGSDITVIDGFFYLIHVGNPGAAWSMFSGQSTLLAILAAATLLGIFLARRTLGLRTPFNQVCFGLLIGGVTGNLLDRMLHDGHVIDFIDLHFGNYIYPTFNVADSGICVGVVLYVIQSFRAPRQENANAKAPNAK